MSEQTQEFESEARVMGWVEKEEFRGNEDDWVDAEAFVKRGREINPILRKNNERLLNELNKTKADLEEVKKAAKEFNEFQKEQFELKIQKYEDKIDALKQAKKDALKEDDHDLVVEIDEQLADTKDALKEAKATKVEEKKDPDPAPQALDPELQEWIDRNDWFGKDAEMSARTNTIGALLAQRNPGLHGKKFLDKLDEALKEEFPNKFGKSNRERPNPVEGSTPGGSSTKGKKHTYENLPPVAKEACDRFVKTGMVKDVNDYLKNYEWDD
jgi:chromosome segregation ATPase